MPSNLVTASQGNASTGSASVQPTNAQAVQQTGPSTANTMPARTSIDSLLNAEDVDPSERIRAGSKRKAETDISPETTEQEVNLPPARAVANAHILEPRFTPNAATTVTAAQLHALDRTSDLYFSGDDRKKRMLANGHAEIRHSNAQATAGQAAAPVLVNNTTATGYFGLAHRADPANLLRAEMRTTVRAELKAEMAASVRTELRNELEQEVRDDLVEEMYVGIYNRQKPRVYERLRGELREKKRVKQEQLDKKLEAKRKRASRRVPEEVKEELRQEGAARLMAMFERAYGFATESGGASDIPDEEPASPTADRPAAPFDVRGSKRTRDDEEESGSISSPRHVKRARANIDSDGQVGDDVFGRSRTPSSPQKKPVYAEDEIVESVETGEIGDKQANRSLLSEISQLRPNNHVLTAAYLEDLEEPESSADLDEEAGSYNVLDFDIDQYAGGLVDEIDEEL